VAWGRRIVVFPAAAAHTHPLFFAAAVTPSPVEMVTSMCYMRLRGTGDAMLLVGTSKGYLQVHHPTGDTSSDHNKLECIHRQRVHESALYHISMSCDSSTICTTAADGVVLLDAVDVLSARQWWLKTGRALVELEARRYEMYTIGPRKATAMFSSTEDSLYDALMAANKRGSPCAAKRAKVAAMSIGSGPPIAWFELNTSAQSKGILSSLVAMSSKMLFGRSAGRNVETGDGTCVVERPDEEEMEASSMSKDRRKLKGDLVSPVASVWDEEKRSCFGLVCWRGEWAACCDSLGRVLVIDVQQRAVVKMIKGYRSCQLAFVAQSGRPHLLTYAPKRRVLELWDVLNGLPEPISRSEATDKGVLIPSENGAYLLDYHRLEVHSVPELFELN
jgi:hypothetical protein